MLYVVVSSLFNEVCMYGGQSHGVSEALGVACSWQESEPRGQEGARGSQPRAFTTRLASARECVRAVGIGSRRRFFGGSFAVLRPLRCWQWGVCVCGRDSA